mmetsp:Transcript_32082/g.68367  ORF Transcript_32082/g.68367 Transcript_32082/m.68367 type:complete len:247 (-) Transcript_32082:401-1141(-)
MTDATAEARLGSCTSPGQGGLELLKRARPASPRGPEQEVRACGRLSNLHEMLLYRPHPLLHHVQAFPPRHEVPQVAEGGIHRLQTGCELVVIQDMGDGGHKGHHEGHQHGLLEQRREHSPHGGEEAEHLEEIDHPLVAPREPLQLHHRRVDTKGDVIVRRKQGEAVVGSAPGRRCLEHRTLPTASDGGLEVLFEVRELRASCANEGNPLAPDAAAWRLIEGGKAHAAIRHLRVNALDVFLEEPAPS